jgi:hypothetical protein
MNRQTYLKNISGHNNSNAEKVACIYAALLSMIGTVSVVALDGLTFQCEIVV